MTKFSSKVYILYKETHSLYFPVICCGPAGSVALIITRPREILLENFGPIHCSEYKLTNVLNWKFTPGYEVVGTISAVGKLVEGFSIAYVAVYGKKVYKICNLTDEEATLVESTSCAIHGLDKLNPSVDIDALIFGAGPTGLVLAQLLKLNGASKVGIAANKSVKTQVARELKCGDEYIEFDRTDPEPQWAQLKERHPYEFDVVDRKRWPTKQLIIRRGGTLMIYSVYSNGALVHWPPAKIFGDEIRIIGSCAQTHCFPRAVAYLDSGKVRVKGMVSDIFAIKDYPKGLDK